MGFFVFFLATHFSSLNTSSSQTGEIVHELSTKNTQQLAYYLYYQATATTLDNLRQLKFSML